MKANRIAALLAACALLAGCGSGSDSGGGAPAGKEAAASTSRTPAPPGASVFFIEPVDGATVSSPVTVKFGISGMSVAPAGDTTPNTGHHHLLIDTELADATQPIPKDDHHLHFGKGQTEASIELAPGQHTLQLVLGDANHVPHDPPVMSKRITVTVQ